MDSLVLNCFGVGDGWPCPERYHSSYLYRFGDTSILLDCGEPVSRSYKTCGLSYDTIDRIFLSHLHFDHIGGFFMLMQGFWLEQRQKDLTVHLPADGIQPIRKLMHTACIFNELLAFTLGFQALKDREPVTVKNVKVTPFATSHLNSLRRAFQRQYPQAYESFCFLLESDRFRVGHSADIGAVTDLAPLVEKPLDLLVCELAHITPEEMFNFLKDKKVKRILFIHLSGHLWERQKEVVALAHRLLPEVHFSFAHDGEEIMLF